MEAALRAGIAAFNAGHFHAAHDAWEELWLELEAETADERFLHGLIQFAAAVHHATTGNDEGARGLADSAGVYLAGLSDPYRDVSLGEVRRCLETIEREGVAVDPDEIPQLSHAGERVEFEDLTREERWIAARLLAEDREGADVDTIRWAIDRARAAEPGSRYDLLVADFVTEADRRGLVYDRLARHVARDRAREADVDSLFDDEDA